MICPKCGHRNAGASWYCGDCGTALSDLNVADSVRGGSRSPGRRMMLVAVALLAATALGLLAARWLDGRAPSIGQRPGLVSEGALDDGASLDESALEGAADEEDAAEAQRAPGTLEPAAPREAGEAGMGGGTAIATAAVPTNPAAAAAAERATALAAGEPSEREAAPPVATREPPSPAPPSATPTLSVRPRPGNPVWTAVRLSEPPTLDGGLNDWTSDFLAFDAVVFGDASDFEGALDVSARTWAGWDDRALYVAARVYDNVFSQPAGAAGRKMYLGDSLELQLDTQLEMDWESTLYSQDDWQIGLSPGDFRGRAPEAWTWRPTNRDAAGIELAALLLEDGYAVEAAVPWSLLGVDPRRTEAIGWALNVSDNDLPRPVQLTMISTSPARSWTDPTTFGTLVLGR